MDDAAEHFPAVQHLDALILGAVEPKRPQHRPHLHQIRSSGPVLNVVIEDCRSLVHIVLLLDEVPALLGFR